MNDAHGGFSAHSPASSDGARRAVETESDPVVSVTNLRKTFGDVVAVDDLSFAVHPGEAVGLLGPNGAGKTTAVKCILGLVVPDDGAVSVCGTDASADPRGAYRHVGATLEGSRNVYWRLTVRENLEFFAGLAGYAPGDRRERHDELLDRFGLADRADDVVNDLSRGMKQKVALAVALTRDVDVVFLDEPTLGLDVESARELRRELRRIAVEEGTAVVLTSHDMTTVEAVCDRVVVVDDGRLVADDTVSNLVDLFRTGSYRIVFEGSLSEAARAAVDAYGAANWTTSETRGEFDVTLTDGNDIHDLTGILVESGVRIVGIDSLEPDLEEAFVRLTAPESPADDLRPLEGGVESR
jgi:ABC-2 type transport system ATP-binding protein